MSEERIIADITKKNYSISGFDGLVLMLYHITDIPSANAIEASQMMKPGKAGMLGAGIYFADTKEAASGKTLHDGVVLKCLVRVGRIMVLSRENNHHITLEKLRRSNMDSVKSVGHKTGSEYVVYDSEQVLAAWVVEGAPERILFPANDTDPRTVCKFGKSCECRDPVHFKRFKHPLAPSFPMRIPPPKQKDPCKYGAKCKHLDIEHFEEYSHPPSVIIPGLDCPYGMRCYRKNPEHFERYNHPPEHPFYALSSSSPVDSPKEDCPYGMRCYRNNPEHFKELRHPPEHPFYASSSSSPKKDCIYGLDCYRKNPEHFERYNHPPEHPFYSSKSGTHEHPSSSSSSSPQSSSSSSPQYGFVHSHPPPPPQSQSFLQYDSGCLSSSPLNRGIQFPGAPLPRQESPIADSTSPQFQGMAYSQFHPPPPPPQIPQQRSSNPQSVLYSGSPFSITSQLPQQSSSGGYVQNLQHQSDSSSYAQPPPPHQIPPYQSLSQQQPQIPSYQYLSQQQQQQNNSGSYAQLPPYQMYSSGQYQYGQQ